MDPSTLRAHLHDDLRSQFRGELLLDPPSRALYASDASLFQVEPLGVAVPRDEADVASLVRYAAERSIPLTARGAATGLAGEALGRGIVVDFSVHFRAILDPGDDWVRVQPGVVLDALNAHLAVGGRRFAPDPASARSCTIGGMLGTNAAGRRGAIHGTTRDHVRQLRVVWDDGTADDVRPTPTALESPRTCELRAATGELLRTHAELIAAHRPKARFDRCGYRLLDVGGADEPDLVRLLVGTEGTLGLITEATLWTVPLPGGRAAAALAFGSFETAVQAGLVAAQAGAVAAAALDQRLLAWRRSRQSGPVSIPADADGVLLVEVEADSPVAAADTLRELVALVGRAGPPPTAVVTALDADAVEHLWGAVGQATTAHVGPRPVPALEDIGVAPDDLPAFVGRAKAVLKRFETPATLLAEPGTGRVDIRPVLDPADPARLWALADELHGLAIEYGGTVSARHGTGLARTPWVARQYGPLYSAFRRLKAVFDPRGILNPGKIVGPDPSHPAWPLRGSAAPPARAVTPLLVWQADEIGRAAGACTGCGACRTTDPPARMCPTFRATGVEAAAPRAKANLMRALLEGRLAGATADDLRAVADLCVNCRMCAAECPERVDVPKLMLEAKAANHAAHGLRRAAWFLARIDGWAAVGSRFAFTANALLGRRSFRWLFERVYGLSRKRTLPRFAMRSFMARARRRGWTRRPAGGPAVAYFVDTYANVFDPAVAEATVAVLRHNGIPVYVPARQRGSGAYALAHGDADVARQRLRHNVRRLADAARAGDTIVCSEPTAALFFRVDGPNLSDDPDVRLVASRTVELSAYLWSLHEQGQLRTDFQPLGLSVGHHVPCHVKALGEGDWGTNLLSLIPGLTASKIDMSCSGMAGTFGLNARNFPVSLEAGRPMLEELARPRHAHGSSECSACRLQMQEGTGKRAAHPVQYLALAYGLMPSVADRLGRPFAGRVSV